MQKLLVNLLLILVVAAALIFFSPLSEMLNLKLPGKAEVDTEETTTEPDEGTDAGEDPAATTEPDIEGGARADEDILETEDPAETGDPADVPESPAAAPAEDDISDESMDDDSMDPDSPA